MKKKKGLSFIIAHNEQKNEFVKKREKNIPLKRSSCCTAKETQDFNILFYFFFLFPLLLSLPLYSTMKHSTKEQTKDRLKLTIEWMINTKVKNKMERYPRVFQLI